VPFLPDDGEGTFDTKESSQVHFEFLKSPPRYSFDDSGIYINGNEAQGSHFKTFHPDELINRTYLTPEDEKGQRFRAKIVEKLHEKQVGDVLVRESPESVSFRVIYEDQDKLEEILSYNEIIDHVAKEIDKDKDPDSVLWQFEEVFAHEGPL